MKETSMKSKQPAKAGRDQRYRSRHPRWTPLLERIQPDTAGIDCGAEQHYVAVPPDRDARPVHAFRTFTADLNQLADWLTQCRIKTVAMESTGVYWIPVFEILEARGIEVVLVNARHLRNVRGRKTDVTDCEWLRDLHSVGLLSASFRPAAEIVVLRTYLRQRASLVEEAASHIQRMQKSLTQMNLMLHLVLSDITGTSGLKIVRSILDGERDPALLAAHRDHRCKASTQEIIAALTGYYRAEHLFTLKQNLDAYEFARKQIAECDSAIQKLFEMLASQQSPPTT
jgi:transposase